MAVSYSVDLSSSGLMELQEIGPRAPGNRLTKH